MELQDLSKEIQVISVTKPQEGKHVEGRKSWNKSEDLKKYREKNHVHPTFIGVEEVEIKLHLCFPS